jgi:hypothetical protein
MKPNRSALIAFLLTLPIGILLSAILFKISAFETFLKSFLTNDGSTPNIFGFIYMIGGLLALPAGLVITLLPMLKPKKGKRRFYILNAAVAILIVILMIPTWGELAGEIYRCDVLHIPNCD